MYNLIVETKDRWLEFIRAKYEAWRRDKIGNEASVSRWAEWLGIDQQTADVMLKKGRIPREPEKINKLVRRYGLDVLAILGYISPDMEDEIIRAWFDSQGLTPED